MVRAVAQGTFDILHPGHVHYLEDAAGMGDELIVIIARRSNVTHKDPPVLPARQRRAVVDALDVVDRTILGDREDIFVPIERLDPDVIVLGYDQHHEAASLRESLEARGIDCRIDRASPYEPPTNDFILSSTKIIDRICSERC